MFKIACINYETIFCFDVHVFIYLPAQFINFTISCIGMLHFDIVLHERQSHQWKRRRYLMINILLEQSILDGISVDKGC